MNVLLGTIPTQCWPHTSSLPSVTLGPYLLCFALSTVNSRYATSAQSAISLCALFVPLNTIRHTSRRHWNKEFLKNTGLYYCDVIVWRCIDGSHLCHHYHHHSSTARTLVHNVSHMLQICNTHLTAMYNRLRPVTF